MKTDIAELAANLPRNEPSALVRNGRTARVYYAHGVGPSIELLIDDDETLTWSVASSAASGTLG